MKNKEKYLNEILEFITKTQNFRVCKDFIRPKVLQANNCKSWDCEDCKQKFKEWLEQEYIEKPKTVFDLEYGDSYYYLCDDGTVCNGEHSNHPIDNGRLNQGNIFLTKDEALYEKRRREVYEIVKKYAYEFSREEWANASINKYHPYYNFNSEKMLISCRTFCKHEGLFFRSKADIEAAIKEVGEADFIKYYLGVRDYEGHKN